MKRFGRQMIGVLSAMVIASAAAAESTVSDDTGVQWPDGFKASIFADGIGPVRHIAEGPDGWLYSALFRQKDGMGGVAMKDQDGDGQADDIRYFAPGSQGTGIRVHDGYLYYGDDQRILRWKVTGDRPVPTGEGDVLVAGFPAQRAHAAKSMAFDGRGHVYVNLGVPSNNCMEKTRTNGSPGQVPCRELENHGGIYRFDANRVGQDFHKDGYRYSTGHRNAVAVAWNKSAGALYLVQHGRDQLGQFFPDLYGPKDNAELPAEEFHRVNEGDNLGWPYSYYDHRVGARIVSPEYGGDGKKQTSEGKKPLVGFPGHWAPNGLLFLGYDHFPEQWHGGALIAFHGSWNRAPEVQAGYRVAFVPMNKKGGVTGDWVTFADGFAGVGEIKSPRDAKHRPIGLAQGRDGAIFVSSSMSGGRIWRVVHAQ